VPALALAAERVRRGEQSQQRPHGDGHLKREVDRLAMLEEVEAPVRRDEVGDTLISRLKAEAEHEAGAASRDRAAPRGHDSHLSAPP